MSCPRSSSAPSSSSALAQELTGYFWCCGRMLGRQNRYAIPDEHGADMILDGTSQGGSDIRDVALVYGEL